MPIRIFAATLAASLLLMSLVGAFLVWKRAFVKERHALAEIEKMAAGRAPLADPGIKLFESAMNRVREGDHLASRDALLELVRVYKDSSRFLEAKRIIGEINMDLLLSRRPAFGKRDYIVQRGDSLGAIARRENCTIDYLMRANGLFGSTIHPGDKITVCPLEFSVVVAREDLRLTLLRKGRFFKEYPVSRVVLSPGTPASFETTVEGKSSWADGRTLLSTDPRYIGGEKWVQLGRRGVVMMPAKEPAAAPPPPPATGATGATGAAAAGATGADAQPGIFLARDDIEEIYCILTTGSSVTVLR